MTIVFIKELCKVYSTQLLQSAHVKELSECQNSFEINGNEFNLSILL